MTLFAEYQATLCVVGAGAQTPLFVSTKTRCGSQLTPEPQMKQSLVERQARPLSKVHWPGNSFDIWTPTRMPTRSEGEGASGFLVCKVWTLLLRTCVFWAAVITMPSL